MPGYALDVVKLQNWVRVPNRRRLRALFRPFGRHLSRITKLSDGKRLLLSPRFIGAVSGALQGS